MTHKAYFVLWIDLRTLRVEHAGIYSEASPTMLGHRFPVCVRTVERATYREARERMVSVLSEVMPSEIFALLERDDDDDDDDAERAS